MAYEVIARKWRPQQFDDLVGQGHIAQTLKNAIDTDRVAHAYLFVGPRGTGKTSTARILAKVLNCEKGPSSTACNECDSCREITAGNNLDVLEIDGASNNGVEQVRDLRDNVRYAPSRGPYKVYIIDEVHMLSVAAFNALLKTLEEPPGHVKFFFATTEPQKVPATILSRCQRFDFRRIPAPEIVSCLRRICDAEGVDIDEAALLAIARGAEGGMRDAQSALDQLIAFRGKKVAEEDVLSVFGLVSQTVLDKIVTAVLESNIGQLIELVAELDEGGKDMQRLLTELLDCFRNLLVGLHVGDGSTGLDLTDLQGAALKEQMKLASSESVLEVVSHLIDAEARMRYTLSKRTVLEMTLVRCARTAGLVGIDQILEEVNKLKGHLGPAAEADEVRPAEKKSPERAPVASAAVPAARETPSPAASVPPMNAGVEANSSVTGLLSQWRDVVHRVGRMAPLAKSALLDAKPMGIEHNVVTIGFDPEFSDSKAGLDHPRNVLALEKVLSDVLNTRVKIRFDELDPNATLPGDTKFERDTESGSSTPRKKDPAEKRGAALNMRDKWIQEPSVAKALEMFNGDIVDIRE